MSSWKANSPIYSEEALQEQYLDALFRLAFLEIEQEGAQGLQQQVDRDAAGLSATEMNELYRVSHPRVLRLIEREARKAVRARFLRRTLPRAAHAAAALLLVFFLGATTAVATSHEVRARLMRLLIQFEDGHASLSLVEDEGAALDVPEGWQGLYYPGYIPEGYAFLELVNDGYTVYFEDTQGQWVVFSENDADTHTNMDTEDSELRNIQVHGAPALMAIKGDRVMITWALFDRYFVLRADTGQEEAMRIAENIKRIH